MSAPVARRVLSGLLLALVGAHLFAPRLDTSWMLAGFLPWDIAYHLLWMLAAAVGVLFMTGPAWPEPEAEREPEGDDEP